MIRYEVVNEFVNEYLTSVTVNKTGSHWNARCPLCGDSKKNLRKKRFHLDYKNGNPIWNCFNCNQSGSFLTIYANLKGLSLEEVKDELFSFDTVRDRLSNKEIFLNEIQKENKINYEVFNWIREKSISRNQEGNGILFSRYKEELLKFCNDRKIPSNYDILICYEGDYKGRIIVPVIDRNNNIIYFQARRLPKSNVEPKYTNPKLEKSIAILNEDKFDENKFIVITEGIIDAYTIGDQGTSCLGGYFSDYLIDLIYKYTKKGVILAFDNPFVDKTGYRNMMRFMKGGKGKPPSKFSKTVKYFIPSKGHIHIKDINMLSVECSINNMYDYILKNSYNYMEAYVKLKLV